MNGKLQPRFLPVRSSIEYKQSYFIFRVLNILLT